MFYVIAVILFFFAAVSVQFIPNPTAWGLVALSIGLLTGGPTFGWWKRSAP